MKDKIVIPIIFSWSAAFSSSCATILEYKTLFILSWLQCYTQYHLSALHKHPQEHHVLNDGVVVDCAVDVAGALVKIQSIVEDPLLSEMIIADINCNVSSPLSVKFIPKSSWTSSQGGSQMNEWVEILPNQGVMFHVHRNEEIQSDLSDSLFNSALNCSYLMKFCCETFPVVRCLIPMFWIDRRRF